MKHSATATNLGRGGQPKFHLSPLLYACSMQILIATEFRYQNPESINLVWSTVILSPTRILQYLGKKNMFRVSHAFQQLPGHCLRPGFVLLPVGEDWDMETSTTTVTQSASSQMSHQASGWQCRSTWRKSRHGHILSYFGCAPSNGLRPATSFQCQQGLHLFLQENFLAVVPGEPDQPCSGWRN